MARSVIPAYTTNQLITSAHGNTYWVANEAAHWAAIQGGLCLIETKLLGAPAASFDFTAIPATYRHLKLIITGRGDTALPNIGVYAIFNADGGANYDWQRVYIADAVVTGSEHIAQTAGSIGNFAAATAPAGLSGASEVMFPDYKGTTFNKTYISNGVDKLSTAHLNIHIYNNYGHWRSSVAINQITITPNAGNFITGSIASLYGIG